jgi:hypothetical protein
MKRLYAVLGLLLVVAALALPALALADDGSAQAPTGWTWDESGAATADGWTWDEA